MQLAEQFRAFGTGMGLKVRCFALVRLCEWGSTPSMHSLCALLWPRLTGRVLRSQDATVIGGLDMQAQLRTLATRPHVVIATPGRLQVTSPE